jgi:ABC-type glycerol-3-phosphate transport system substrate-binding protein
MHRLILIILLLAFLTACRYAPGPEAIDTAPAVTQTEQVTITLAVSESDLAGYRPLIEQFEAQYSHIRVRLVADSEIISSEEPDRIAALAAFADLFAYSPTIHESQQYLLDLRPLLNADPSFDANDFLPGLLDDGNSLWSLPVAASYPLIFFNKAAFDAAGLTHPEPGWTLDDFLTAAQALAQREGDEVVQWGYVPFQIQPLLATRLAAPLVVDGQPRLTDPDVAEALQWLADLFTLHQVSPWLENYKPFAQREASGGPDPLSLVREGQAAMWSADHTVWQFGFADENIGLATIPRSQQGYAADAVRYGFAISRGTVQPQAAWTLLTFLSQQPPVDSVIDLLLPARRSVAAADGYWERVPAVMAEPLQYAADNNTVPRFTPAAVDLMRGVLTAVIVNNESATDALAQTQATVTGRPAVVEAATPFAVATPEGEPATAEEIVTEIVFVVPPWEEVQVYHRLARTFNEANPDVRVTVRRIDGNFYEAITNTDCFTSFTGIVRDDNTLVQPANALFDLDFELAPDDFYPETIAALTQQGQLLGIPASIHVPLIQYNRSLFAAAGIAEPSFDWTLAEFLETGQALTNPSTEQYGFTVWETGQILYHAFVQFDVEPFTESEGVAIIDYAAIAPVAHWYVDLVRRYGVHPALPGDLIPWRDYFDRHDLFVELAANGQVAMWPDDRSDRVLVERLRSADVETGLAPFPLGPSGYSFSITNNLTAYFIAADSLHPQLCWQWLKFLITQPTATRHLPAHIDTAESNTFAEHVGSERAAAYLASAGSGDLFFQSDHWLQPGMLWLTAVMETAAKGEIEVDSALAGAVNKFTRYRDCVIERQAFDNQTEWQACALEVDSDLGRRYN